VATSPGRLLRWIARCSPCANCGWDHDGLSAWRAARANAALHRSTEARRLARRAVEPHLHQALPPRFEVAARALAAEGP
jgi:hypothetical protein